MVSIIIIETGPTKNTFSGVTDLWESGIMDVLFEAGHIVSNSPAIYISKIGNEDPPAEVAQAFKDAGSGGVDYFIIAQLYYSKTEEPVSPKPEQIALKLYKLRPLNVLYSTEYTNDSNTPVIEEFSNAKKAARILIPYIREYR
jgi:uncharacterized protein (DUF111 family)